MGEPINHFRPPTSPLLFPPPLLFSFNFIFLLSLSVFVFSTHRISPPPPPPLPSLLPGGKHCMKVQGSEWSSFSQPAASPRLLLPSFNHPPPPCPPLKLCPRSLPLPHGKKYPDYMKNTGQMCVGVCEYFRKLGQIVCTHTHIVVSEWELLLHVLDQLN